MRTVLSALIFQSFTRRLTSVNKLFRFILLPLLLYCAFTLPAWGRREGRNITVQEEIAVVIPSVSEQNTEVQSIVVQVSGRVRLVGTSLFPELVITGADMEWFINNDEIYKLTDLQHRTITIEGTETVTQLTWASGIPAGERRILKDITIIDIE